MTIEVKVPVLPESVSDATIASWHKKPGDAVKRDENLVDLETDKVVLEVPSPADGVLKEIKQETGATVTSQQLLAVIEEGATAAAAARRESAGQQRRNAAAAAPAPTARQRRDVSAAGENERSVARRPARRDGKQNRSFASSRHRPRRPVTKEDLVNFMRTRRSAMRPRDSAGRETAPGRVRKSASR